MGKENKLPTDVIFLRPLFTIAGDVRSKESWTHLDTNG